MKFNRERSPAALALALAAAAGLSACAPLVVGGAVVGGMMVTDRRTTGNQVEDQSIELKAPTRVSDAIGKNAHVNLTSYNRVVLATGEVPTEGERVAVEQAVMRVEGVRSVVNEVAVMGNSSMTARSSDSIITGRIKAALLDAKDMQSNSIKVVTERGVVYLMGRVSEREAMRAADIARGQAGVLKVVRVFELLTEAELAGLQPKPPPK
ncbi:MAG TPA: BON domain-containing protein [Rubrivivax sp.]